MIQEHQQIISIIDTLKTIIRAMKEYRISEQDLENVLSTLKEVNHTLYGVEWLKFQGNYDFSNNEDYHAFVGELEALTEIWSTTIERQNDDLEINKRFWIIYEKFKYEYPDDIYKEVMDRFFALPEGQRIEYLSLNRRYPFLKNSIDISEDNYSLIIEYIEMMVENVEKYRFLYEKLEDFRSKYILIGIIEYWFDFKIDKMNLLAETVYKDYFDLDIVQPNSKEVYVDLGAHTGDRIIDFINTYGKYKQIYAYEVKPDIYETLHNKVGDYRNIDLRQKGVNSGDTQVEVVSLDSDIQEEITLVKMDIEGAEKDAIIGAKQHILNEKPKMIISAYHLSADIFDIPVLIHSIRDDYKFYIRFNGHGIWPCDYTIYAC